MNTQNTVTLGAFSKMSGEVFAPTHLTDDMSDYVKVVKKDLIDSLRHYGITHVRYSVDSLSGNLIFIEGIQGEFEETA